MENKTLLNIIKWVIIIAMPFFLGLGMILAVIAWDYPSFEYQRIPPDQFGFSPEERLFYAHATLDYLQRSEPSEEAIFLLEELRLPNSDEPLYNEREIGHMIDVKDLTDAIRTIWWITAVLIVVGLGFLLSQPALRAVGYRAIYQGGWATVIILAGIAIFIGVGWSIFFVQFHELLFPPGSWTFAYSDSLIRLFPEQFWFDIGVIMSGGALLLGIVVTVLGYWLTKKM
ncbi:TIGR01906 family membrane protein [Candidatus Leptofilum sp.]|uniref:TIGR01906 family membrane protein n=1 Tax=Candidatus Leptofilum sp. TaxID=3241576 RepID=UPI003B5CDD8E